MSEPHLDQSCFAQTDYQVRLDWGVAGLARLAPADIVVVVDVLRFSTRVTRALEADPGAHVGLDGSAHALSVNGAAISHSATLLTAPNGEAPIVLLGCLRNASAVARVCLEIQDQRARRTSIAVIASGEREGTGLGAPVRFAVEDQLGAGAVVAALSALGTDHTSPDAAAACEALTGLRPALRHLVSASGSGLELLAKGEGPDVAAAGASDVTDVVPILRDGAFVAY